jgi:large subunit ribosomal protein L21
LEVRSDVFAIVETGGKQYRIAEGQTIEVEKLAVPEGETVTLDRVLMVADDDQVHIGKPLVEGARVEAKVVDQDRGPKQIVFKYKPKIRYRRKTGHRQSFTRLHIERIVV